MKNYVLKIIKENKKSIKVFIFCIVLGLATGIVSYNFLSVDNKHELVNSVENTLDICKNENFEKVSILQNGLKSNLYTIILFLIVSTTIVAPMVFCCIFFLKGFAIGIYISVIYSIFGFWDGTLSNFLINIIPNLIFIPVYIFIGIKTIDFHYYICGPNSLREKIKSLIYLGYSYIISMPFFFLSIVIEQIVFPIVLNIYIKI
ncbi:MAG: hypothetical protein PHD15_01280 [Clostridia bacterium]|nr:hypothetical protein [Clostridia bacterium]MDD4386381.1 hypothetical protein [Clostridia bacterium]